MLYYNTFLPSCNPLRWINWYLSISLFNFVAFSVYIGILCALFIPKSRQLGYSPFIVGVPVAIHRNTGWRKLISCACESLIGWYVVAESSSLPPQLPLNWWQQTLAPSPENGTPMTNGLYYASLFVHGCTQGKCLDYFKWVNSQHIVIFLFNSPHIQFLCFRIKI
jgi:hypothetical protein